MTSSALTRERSSLCSSSDTLNSFLSSVIKLSLSWSTKEKRLTSLILFPQMSKEEKGNSNSYPSNGIRLSFKGPKNRTVSFLLNLVDLGLHVAMHPWQWSRTNWCRSSVPWSTTCSLKSILMRRRKIIISSCKLFTLGHIIIKVMQQSITKQTQ